MSTATKMGSAVKRSPESKKLVVIYCQGGSQRCRWIATEPRHDDTVGALVFAEDLNRRGYKTKTKTVHELDTIGLPIGWDSSTNVEDWELRPDGFHWYCPEVQSDDPTEDDLDHIAYDDALSAATEEPLDLATLAAAGKRLREAAERSRAMREDLTGIGDR